jgi:hypothetical protein
LLDHLDEEAPSSFVFLALILITACSKKQEEQKAAPAAPAEPAPVAKPTEPSTMPPPASTEPSAAANLTCDQFVTAQVLAAHFKGATVEPGAVSSTTSVQCAFKAGGAALPASFLMMCSDDAVAKRDATTADLQKIHGAGTTVTDVGKGGVLFDLGDAQRIVAYDDDSNCQIDATVPKSMDARALARDLLGNVPKK